MTTHRLRFLPAAASAVTLVLGPLCGLSSAQPKPADAQPAKPNLLSDVKVPPGFEATIFAAPPDVSYPTCVACLPNGDVLVGIDENGSLGRKPGRGKIVLCRDTDGDGRADKFITFAKIDTVRGLIWDDGKLYVLHPPSLSVLTDKDGDGVADGPAETLLTGLGPGIEGGRGGDHTTNSMRLGVDGWIYIAVGDYGFPAAKGKDGRTLVFHGGGVARVRPDGTGLELVSRGQRNIYDVAVSPTLEMFTRDNTNDGDGWDVRFSHVVMGADFGYPRLFKNFPDEIIQPLADYGGGSPTGALYVSEASWPAGFGDTVLTCEWGRGGVFLHNPERHGASYKAPAAQKMFVQMPRPTGIDLDASGRLYVASWKDGGFDFSKPDVGFVTRVTPTGLKATPLPDVKKATEAELIAHLSTGSGVQRLLVQREIIRRGDKPGVVEGLTKLAGSDAPLAARVAGVFAIKQILGVKSHEALAALAGKADLREYLLRAVADRKEESAGAPVKLFADACGDADPRVRLQATTGLSRLGAKDAAAALVPLVADADPVVAHVAVRSLIELGAAEPCLKALDAGDAKLRPGLIRVLQSLPEPAVADAVLSRFAAAKDALRVDLFRCLCRLARVEDKWDLKWWGTRPDTRGPFYRPVAWEGSAKIEAALNKALAEADPETATRFVVEMFRHRIETPDATARLLKAAAENPKFRGTAVDLLSRQSALSPEAAAMLESVALDPAGDPDARGKALRALAKAADKPESLAVAVKALSEARGDGKTGVGGDKVPDPVRFAWDDFVRDATSARHVDAFVKLTESDSPAKRELAWTVLVHLAVGKNVPAKARETAAKAVDRAFGKAVPETAVPLLRAVGFAKAEEYSLPVNAWAKDGPSGVREAAAEVAKRLRPPADRKDAIAKLKYEDVLAAVMKTPGDPKAGAQFFVKQTCVNCHTISKSEPPKGPYLGDIANRYKREELAESILKPSAKIAQGFETQIFRRTDGTVETGFVVRESGEEVELRTATGASVIISKEDIDARKKSELSVMPEGLVANLTPGELASLIAYLESLAKDAKPAKP